MAALGFSSCFDSGNGKLEGVDPAGATAAATMRVQIEDDPYTEVDGRAHRMWFHFKVFPHRLSPSASTPPPPLPPCATALAHSASPELVPQVSNLQTLGGEPLRVCLTNAGGCSYPGGWGGPTLAGTPEGAAPYRACFSTDRTNW